jgi:hypothetical protein
LSGFPWPIIFKPDTKKIKLLTEYEDVTQKVLFGNAVLAALMSGRKYDVINQNGDFSPDITPLDFFLWGYIKDIVYKTPVTSLDELKLRIVAAIKQLHRKCWRTLGGKLNTVWTSYVPRKARMLKLFSILQY